jgi:hypothetical protein
MGVAFSVDKSSSNLGQNHLSSGQQRKSCNHEEGQII